MVGSTLDIGRLEIDIFLILAYYAKTSVEAPSR